MVNLNETIDATITVEKADDTDVIFRVRTKEEDMYVAINTHSAKQLRNTLDSELEL